MIRPGKVDSLFLPQGSPSEVLESNASLCPSPVGTFRLTMFVASLRLLGPEFDREKRQGIAQILGMRELSEFLLSLP